MSIKGIYSINILSFVTNLKKNIIGNQIIPYLKKLNKSLMKQKFEIIFLFFEIMSQSIFTCL